MNVNKFKIKGDNIFYYVCLVRRRGFESRERLGFKIWRRIGELTLF